MDTNQSLYDSKSPDSNFSSGVQILDAWTPVEAPPKWSPANYNTNFLKASKLYKKLPKSNISKITANDQNDNIKKIIPNEQNITAYKKMNK